MSKENVPFEPLSDFLLVEVLKVNQTHGGIALPDGANPDPPKARVVKVGPGRVTETGFLVPMSAKPGDLVYVMAVNAQFTPVTISGKEYAVIRSRDLVAIVPESK